MRVLAIIAWLSLGVALISGCSAIPATQPMIAMPIALADRTINATTAFVKEDIDVTHTDSWRSNAGRIAGYEGISLTVAAVNETGQANDPAEVHLQFYISDRGDLTPETVGEAVPLMTANFPGGMRAMQYDSGSVPLSPAAGQVLRDGVCALYITATPSGASLRLSQAMMHLKVRSSLL